MRRCILTLGIIACGLCLACKQQAEPLDVLANATSEAELMELRHHPDPNVRWGATARLAGPAPRSAEKNGLFKQFLFDKDVATEITTDPVSLQLLTLVELWASARFRGDADFQELVPDLITLLGDGDPVVRGLAASLLGHSGPPPTAALPALRRCYERESRDSRVKWTAAFAMERIEPDSMAAEIREAIQDADVLPCVVRVMGGYAITGAAGTQFMEDILTSLCRITTGEMTFTSQGADADRIVSRIEELLLDYGRHEPELVELYRSYLGCEADESISWIVNSLSN